MEDANKRIDLAAPLLSVRRHGGGAGAERATGTPCSKPAEDDAAAPGGVPFGWERRPGHPKSVRTTRRAPPLQKAPDEAVAVAVVAAALPVPEDAARFSDTLSRVDSCFTVNCSVTGISDAGAPAGDPSAGGGVMTDRFLPAAKAVAVGFPHPQRPIRKGAAAAAAAAADDVSAHEPARPAPANARTGVNRDISPRRFPVEHSPANHVPSNYAKDMNDGDDDEEWDVHSTAGFSSKRCGLLPTRCVKCTLLLLNPAQAMTRYGCGGGARRGQARRFLPRSGRARREMTPLLRRPRNEQHVKHDASMTWEEVYINSLLRSDRRGCLKPGTLASELDSRTVRELYTNRVGGVHPKATHLGLLLVLDRNDEYNGYDHCSSAQNFPDAVETASLLLAPKSSRPANGGNKSRRDAGHGFTPVVEEKVVAASRDMVPLLPLPPPKSPSESWLSRALPSVSSKPPVTSFLGIHVQQQPRRQTTSPWCSSDQARVGDHAMARQTRIYDVQK